MKESISIKHGTDTLLIPVVRSTNTSPGFQYQYGDTIGGSPCEVLTLSMFNRIRELEARVEAREKLLKSIADGTFKRCCGRCMPGQDECVSETTCSDHKVMGCEICFGPKNIAYHVHSQGIVTTPQKLVPFDLTRALAGDPVIVVPEKFTTDAPFTELENVTKVGNWICSHKKGDPNDLRRHQIGVQDKYLFMAPKTRTVWVNLYTRGFEMKERDEDIKDIGCIKWFSSENKAKWFDEENKVFGQRLGGRAYPIEIQE